MARARRLLSLVLVVLTLLAAPVAAQDPTTTSTTSGGVPSRDIVPKPNAGSAPTEAGDRGGALQLGLLGLLVVVIAGAVTGLVRQSRRARDQGPG